MKLFALLLIGFIWLPQKSWSQYTGKIFVQFDTLISDDGEILDFMVKGYLFASENEVYSFDYMESKTDLGISFNRDLKLKKNIKHFIKFASKKNFEGLEKYKYKTSHSASHQLIQFTPSVSFDPYLPADLLILDKQIIEIYKHQGDCEHCYHSLVDDMYFYLYEDFKVSRKYRKLFIKN